MTLKEIVVNWLRQHGFHGLFNDFECGCEVADLMPCGEPKADCRPGYRRRCPEDCGEHDFHIVAHQDTEG